MTSGKSNGIIAALCPIASRYGLQFSTPLWIEVDNGWIGFRQSKGNNYIVRISMPGGAVAYASVKLEICAVFHEYGAVLKSERAYRNCPDGVQRELVYVDKSEYRAGTAMKR